MYFRSARSDRGGGGGRTEGSWGREDTGGFITEVDTGYPQQDDGYHQPTHEQLPRAASIPPSPDLSSLPIPAGPIGSEVPVSVSVDSLRPQHPASEQSSAGQSDQTQRADRPSKNDQTNETLEQNKEPSKPLPHAHQASPPTPRFLHHAVPEPNDSQERRWLRPSPGPESSGGLEAKWPVPEIVALCRSRTAAMFFLAAAGQTTKFGYFFL